MEKNIAVSGRVSLVITAYNNSHSWADKGQRSVAQKLSIIQELLSIGKLNERIYNVAQLQYLDSLCFLHINPHPTTNKTKHSYQQHLGFCISGQKSLFDFTYKSEGLNARPGSPPSFMTCVNTYLMNLLLLKERTINRRQIKRDQLWTSFNIILLLPDRYSLPSKHYPHIISFSVYPPPWLPLFFQKM